MNRERDERYAVLPFLFFFTLIRLVVISRFLFASSFHWMLCSQSFKSLTIRRRRLLFNLTSLLPRFEWDFVKLNNVNIVSVSVLSWLCEAAARIASLKFVRYTRVDPEYASILGRFLRNHREEIFLIRGDRKCNRVEATGYTYSGVDKDLNIFVTDWDIACLTRTRRHFRIYTQNEFERINTTTKPSNLYFSCTLPTL